jgi:hypothetical protein
MLVLTKSELFQVGVAVVVLYLRIIPVVLVLLVELDLHIRKE